MVRHANSDSATVRIGWGEDLLEIRVRDHGTGPAEGAVAAAGQLGMQERVAMWGGDLSAGAAPGGGYEVVARLPRNGDTS